MSEHDLAKTATAAQPQDPTAWWGEFPLEIGAWGNWHIGPLTLWVSRTEHDWQIAFVRGDDPFRDRSRVEVPTDPQRAPIPPEAEQHRVAFARTEGPLELQPMLADRPVVARPETTFSIPPGERVSVYVSSAVWLRLVCGPQKERLIEIPTWRPSDTWFGNNLSGFLCYATRTAMRLSVDEFPLRLHRALTPILIDNRGKNALNVDRISLPIPNLSVFVSPAGGLWTDPLHLTREEDSELALVHIENDGVPVPGAVKLRGPREIAENNLLSRVFTGLFG